MSTSLPPESEFDERLPEIVDEILKRAQAGEKFSIEEYTDKYPDLADKIREVAPTIQFLEAEYSEAPSNKKTEFKALSDSDRDFGDYLLEEEIGRGGMGIVYRAKQKSLNRTVALKTLPYSILPDQKLIDRFFLEARAAASLQHSNIVPVFDVGQQKGICFYTMRMIEGHGLDRILDELREGNSPQTEKSKTEVFRLDSTAEFLADKSEFTRSLFVSKIEHAESHSGADDLKSDATVSESTVVDSSLSDATIQQTTYSKNIAIIGERIADALAHLHENGILHRDIKPSNLLIEPHGHVWLTDFGLAKFDRDDLTRTGGVVGTLRYMAPEQLEGWSDPRTDIYGLGITLYEMLALNSPFLSDERSQLTTQILHEEPRRLREQNPAVPIDLETIIHKAISKENQDRYRSASEFRDDLKRFCENRPIVARRATVGERIRLWAKRNPRIAVLSSTIVALLVLIVFGLAYATFTLSDSLARTKSAEENERAMRIASNEDLYDSNLLSADALSSNSNQGRRNKSLQLLSVAIDLARELKTFDGARMDLRNRVLQLLPLVDVAQATSISLGRPTESILECRVDHRGKNVALLLSNGRIEIQELGTQTVLAKFELPPEFALSRSAGLVKFSPNDKYLGIRLVGEKTGRLLVFDIVNEKLLKNYEAGAGERTTGFEFSPYHPEVAFVRNDSLNERTLRIQLVNFLKPNQPPRKPDFGNLTLVPRGPAGTRYEFLKKSINVEFVVENNSTVREILFCPDGDHILAITSAEALLYHRATLQLLGALVNPDSPVIHSCAWSPNGRFIAFGCADANVYVWDISNAKSHWKTLRGHLGKVEHVSFSPSSQMLLSRSKDQTTRIWDPFRGLEMVRFGYGGNGFTVDQKIIMQPTRQTAGMATIAGLDAYAALNAHSSISSIPEVGFRDNGRIVYGSSRFQNSAFFDVAGRKTVFTSHAAKSTSAGIFSSHLHVPFVGFTPNWDLKAEQNKQAGVLEINPAFQPERPVIDDGNLHPIFCADGLKTPVDEFKSFQAETRKPRWLEFQSVYFMDLVKIRLPNGNERTLFAACKKDSGTTTIWEIKSASYYDEDCQREHLIDIDHDESPSAIPTFSPDGTYLGLGLKGQFMVYETREWDFVLETEKSGEAYGKLGFSPDNRWIAMADTSFVRLNRFQNNQLEEVGQFRGSQAEQFTSNEAEGVCGIAFSPDNRLLAAGSLQHALLLWDLEKINDQLKQWSLNWD